MQWLSVYPVVLSEYLVDTVDAVIVKRTFRPGVRKGKRAGQLTKVYVLKGAYQVPSKSYLLVGNRIVVHPDIWAKLNTQMPFGWM